MTVAGTHQPLARRSPFYARSPPTCGATARFSSLNDRQRRIRNDNCAITNLPARTHRPYILKRGNRRNASALSGRSASPYLRPSVT